jgi:hypothetical protein
VSSSDIIYRCIDHGLRSSANNLRKNRGHG